LSKKTSKTESKLKKFGVPASYIAITAMLVSLFCQTIGACE